MILHWTWTFVIVKTASHYHGKIRWIQLWKKLKLKAIFPVSKFRNQIMSKKKVQWQPFSRWSDSLGVSTRRTTKIFIFFSSFLPRKRLFISLQLTIFQLKQRKETAERWRDKFLFVFQFFIPILSLESAFKKEKVRKNGNKGNSKNLKF